MNNYKLVNFDNQKENTSISKRYNSFLNSFDYSQEVWLVFCHEDFFLKENLEMILNNLDVNYIYGPIGTSIKPNLFKTNLNDSNISLPLRATIGQIIQKDKNGKNEKLLGKYIFEQSALVDTLDCCCLIMHSSLIKKYNLRFDENLTFDLYSEAFSIEAKEKYKIQSKAIQISCEHWSIGNITERYYQGLNYLNNKYPQSLYSGTCSLIGGKSLEIGKKTIDLIPYLRAYQIIGAESILKLALFLFRKIYTPLLGFFIKLKIVLDQ